MVNYNLLGQSVEFSDAAERFYDLQFAANQACTEISRQFAVWYKKSGNIQTVLAGYNAVIVGYLRDFAFEPLYLQLADCEIYDVSKESYWKQCIRLTRSDDVLQIIEEQYETIVNQQNNKYQYRSARKANRGRWRGGGFGLSGALQGAAEAAALNAVSGLGHSAFNAVGNAGSALVAAMDKSSLYQSSNTQIILLQAVCEDLFSAFQAHMDFLNERKPNYIQSVFNSDRSTALFENAKKIPEKQFELLVQSFTLCPWNQELIQYIFVNFPNERKCAYDVAQRFSIDLCGAIEDILAKEYDASAQASETTAQAARARILECMKEYHVTESATLDRLDTDCLERICSGYEFADEATCKGFLAAIREYQTKDNIKSAFREKIQARIGQIWIEDLEKACNGYENADEVECTKMLEKIRQSYVSDDIKAPFEKKVRKRIEKIWAEELNTLTQNWETMDEATCEQLIKEIQSHKAPDKMKKSHLNTLELRLKMIWAAEDGEIFDDIYRKTDITDPSSIKKAENYILSNGRTVSSQKYIKALQHCTPKTIHRARLYKYSKRSKLLYILMAFFIVFSSVLPFVGIPMAIFLFIQAKRLKAAWNTLTIKGTIIHPALAPDTVQRANS